MTRDKVVSSNLRSVGYDPVSKTLEIEFKDGSIYQYHDVPQREYDSLMRASSKGKYFAEHIRDQYDCYKIK